jgi:hypothetical protein
MCSAIESVGGEVRLSVNSSLRSSIRQGGLNEVQLSGLVSDVSDAVGVTKYGWSLDDMYGMMNRGSVIAHVDGNHWVHVQNAFSKLDGSTWVRVYDSGRGGYYTQAAESFFSRTRSTTPIINVRR